MLKLTQGNDIFVNMNQVCHIMTDGAHGSVLTFNAVMDNCPAYIVVKESPYQINELLSSALVHTSR